MKKLLLILSLTAPCFASYAQNTFPASGNVGIGTTSPFSLFQVQGVTSRAVFVDTATPSASSGSGMQGFINAFPTAAGQRLGFFTLGSLNSGSTMYNAISVTGWSDGPWTTTSTPAYVTFDTNSAGTVGHVERMRLTSTGLLGIGTTTPQAKLDVNGTISMQSFANLSSQRTTNNNFTSLFLGGALKDNNDGTFTVVGDGGSNYFGAIRMDNTGSNAGAINFYTGASTGGNSYAISSSTLASDLAMSIVGGNVAIGTSNPQGYKLAVNGSAIATSMTVKLNANWPDYVFNSTYKLPPLNLVEVYIDQNHHLSGVPSAEKIAKDGINLGDMDIILTKKVEELTLYMIEKDKQLNDEKQFNAKQQLQLDAQSQQLISQKEQLQVQEDRIEKLERAIMKLTESGLKQK